MIEMIKLHTFPLDLEFDDAEKKLYFEGVELTPMLRTLKDMQPVCLDKAFLEKVELERVQYYVYRGITQTQYAHLFQETNLSFDITVIPALEIGREYNKTYGHYHPKSASGSRYPEIYEVLEGEAHFLIQRLVEATKNVDEVMLIKAKKGEKVVVPNGYGHITINPGNSTLVISNIWMSLKGEYELYSEKEGAAYYEVIDDSLIPNEKYENLPLIKTLEAMDLPLNQEFDGDNIYAQFIENHLKFDFLRK